MKRTNSRKNRKRIKIANKPRFMLFSTLCLIMITTCIGSFTSAQATKTAQTYTLCVAAGDTLWEIARSSNTENKDLRRVIDDIMKLNNMRTANLHVGDTLQIPIY